MTDTPGWASPSSSGTGPEDVRPPAVTPPGPDGTSATVPAQEGPPAAYQGAYGTPQAPSAPQAPHPTPGWGPQGGWGGPPPGGHPGWSYPPPSPKPGVIPLRPLGVGEILDGSIATARRHWRTVLGLSLVVAVLTQTTVTAIEWWSRNGGRDLASAPLLGVGALLSQVAVLLMTALLTIVVSHAILGKSITLGEAWRAARPQLWKLVGLTLLITLVVVGIMLAGFVPLIVLALVSDGGPVTALGLPFALAGAGAALWMYLRLSLATSALMLEKQGVRAAMARSRRLVRGSWWRIFGIRLLGVLLSSLLSGMVTIPFTVIASASGSDPITSLGGDPSQAQPLSALVILAIGGVIASTITFPIQAGINVLLYVDQRIRREALDLELARAAGLPEYGGTGWAGQGQSPTGA
ncbi:glycerophosphoryl diester phosphodiesterase membrane domain-containing protein [Kitasatospora nipponensis]|uniref:Glycerophosphoryl diester phosphodiesterase membrane domain-containing protein n=1 Tax=Kitasatospora nipponensis TaxID=258049 RepID=A0ABN1VZ78_9ACTN